MKAPLILLSHLALGLAGWAITWQLQSNATHVQAENSRPHSTRQRPTNVPGTELVHSIESRLEKAKSAKAQLAAAPGAREKILAALTGLALPADPAAAIRTLLTTDGESSIQAAALFTLWAKSDPAAALGFASNREEFNKMKFNDEALELVGESITTELALAMPKGNRDPLFSGLARQLVASRTIEELTALLSGLEADVKSTLSFHLGEQWPAERLNDFGRLATAMKDPEMLDRIRDKLPPEEMARWMMRYIHENPDREFAASVTRKGTLFYLLLNQPGIPLEDRLAEVMERPLYEHQPAEAARKDAMALLARDDVNGFFHGDDGPDFRYAFHHGKIEAPKILAKLSARFPQYAAAGLLPALLHQQLTSEDPDRAAPLIADLPDAERARVMIESAWSIPNLDVLGRVLFHFPASNDEAVLAFRQKLWRAVTDHGLDHYGEDYLRWISRLPDPRDRTMALEAIADRIDGSMDDKADEIRGIVGDIRLRDAPKNTE